LFCCWNKNNSSQWFTNLTKAIIFGEDFVEIQNKPAEFHRPFFISAAKSIFSRADQRIGALKSDALQSINQRAGNFGASPVKQASGPASGRGSQAPQVQTGRKPVNTGRSGLKFIPENRNPDGTIDRKSRLTITNPFIREQENVSNRYTQAIKTLSSGGNFTFMSDFIKDYLGGTSGGSGGGGSIQNSSSNLGGTRRRLKRFGQQRTILTTPRGI
jgi:hypothetical protein